MNLADVEPLARNLMDHHGLTDWSFEFDRAVRRAGKTTFDTKVISVSKVLAEMYTEEQVRSVVLHEIAHAIAGPHHGHDATWKKVCLAIGGDGHVRMSGGPEPEPIWIGTCPNGHQTGRFRRPASQLSCGTCAPGFSHEALFTWKNTDTGAIISPADLPLHRSRPRRSRRRRISPRRRAN